jgi:hypothetical protein
MPGRIYAARHEALFIFGGILGLRNSQLVITDRYRSVEGVRAYFEPTAGAVVSYPWSQELR